MGITFVSGTVFGANGKQQKLDFLVDSGAVYTLLPHQTWTELELKPKRSMKFSLADGQSITRAVSECRIELELGDATTPVILGEEGDEPLLGAVTLEELGLVLNPFRRRLEPMNALLM